MKIAVVGAGKMGGALAIGLSRGKGVELLICDHSMAKAKRIAGKCHGKAMGAKEAAGKADVIIIAVKPDAVESVLAEIKGELGYKLLISIATGIPVSYLRKRVPKTCVIALAMPNIAAENGMGATAYFSENGKAAALVEKILAPTGIAIRAKKEAEMDFAILSGSGIAFFFSAIEGMARAGEKNGMAYKQALQLAAMAAQGAGSLALGSGRTPHELEESVATKKGITVRGLAVLRKAKNELNYFRAAATAMDEARRRRENNSAK